MQLPTRVWAADQAVRRAAAQDWVAARLAWESRLIGRRRLGSRLGLPIAVAPIAPAAR